MANLQGTSAVQPLSATRILLFACLKAQLLVCFFLGACIMFYQEKENWSYSCFSVNVDLNSRKLSAVLEMLLENMAAYMG